jgi:hypothetical protein
MLSMDECDGRTYRSLGGGKVWKNFLDANYFKLAELNSIKRWPWIFAPRYPIGHDRGNCCSEYRQRYGSNHQDGYGDYPGSYHSGRERGQQRYHDRVHSRIRPIFMTSTTTVFAMLPLVVSRGTGSELYRGLGSAVLGGLAFFMLFTLILIPTLYSLWLDFRAPAVNRVTEMIPGKKPNLAVAPEIARGD